MLGPGLDNGAESYQPGDASAREVGYLFQRLLSSLQSLLCLQKRALDALLPILLALLFDYPVSGGQPRSADLDE